MIDAVQIFWSPSGVSLPSLDTKSLVDIHDGDTPSIRMPVRMLSIDTPEVTARSTEGAARMDVKLAQLAQWIQDRPGEVPISRRFADHLLPKLTTGTAGTLQFTQGTAAADFAKSNAEQRLTRPNGTKRLLFVRTADTPFEGHGRLLAYVAPNYSKAELQSIPRAERSTFNLDMVRAGWAVPFILYPSIPGELDLPLMLEAAANAAESKLGIWADEHSLPAYEYRSAERLYAIAKAIIVDGEPVGDRFGWRERYCVDMRTRVLFGPEDYFEIDPVYRLWLWQADVREAVARLNLTPSPLLVGAA
ncbi:thermonuclease family protein [Mycolicibacterium sp. HK-90]|uniref:thermonuclease family protein n=1 Tax=Mycolicibacterium sp. HK-90 TaxID=3056937 RepID=UPI0026594618|nr:thermonuclease family protein [Mycolicibacterium sp. HK-90]WKG00761.1 thermonuclease family protein [Mycolicibacterium sp. HK-90]